MPQRTYRFPSLITRFVLLSLAAVALTVLRRASRADTRVQKTTRRRSGVRRIAVSLSFATLFFAGAAFSAGAGDVVANLVEQQAVTASEAPAESVPDASACPDRPSDWQFEEGSEEPACEEAEAPAEVAPEAETAVPVVEPGAEATETPDAESPSASDLVEQTATAEAAATATASNDQPASKPSLSDAVQTRARAEQPHSQRTAPSRRDDGAPAVLKPATLKQTSAGTREPELDDPNSHATIWLHRTLRRPHSLNSRAIKMQCRAKRRLFVRRSLPKRQQDFNGCSTAMRLSARPTRLSP